MNFYEVANDYMEKLEIIQSGINPETGEVTEDKNQLAVWKEEIAKDIQAKSQNIIAVFRNEKRTIQAIEEEIKRLSEMKDKRKKKLNNFEDWVKTCMLSYNIEKIETPIGKLCFSNSEAVEIFDESLIDEKFIKEKIDKTISKTEIKKAIKAGEEVQGARIVKNKNLQIK